MKSYFFIITAILLFVHVFGFSQNNIDFIDSISCNICNQLEYNDQIKSLKHNDFKFILGSAIIQYKNEWDDINKKIMKDEKFSVSYLNFLLQHRLLQECPKYRELDNNFQSKVFSDDRYKNLYVSCKTFVLEAEQGADPLSLQRYFSSVSDKSELIEKISQLQEVLLKNKKESVLFFNNSGDQLYFYVSVIHYASGEDLAAIMIRFNNTDDALIDEWEFRTKEELSEPEEIEIDEEMIRITRDELQNDTLK